MKRSIHPNDGPVVFRDRSANVAFLARSTKSTHWEDGNTYPVIDLDIPSASHPCSTGKQVIGDTAGRVERSQHRHDRG